MADDPFLRELEAAVTDPRVTPSPDDRTLGEKLAPRRPNLAFGGGPVAAERDRYRAERDAARILMQEARDFLVAVQAERDNALAEVERLERELRIAQASERAALAAEAGRATPVIAGWERMREAAAERDSWQRMAERLERDYAALAARLERAEAERDEAQQQAVELLEDALDHGGRSDLKAVEADRDAMRAVVEAAEAEINGPTGRVAEPNSRRGRLVAAVDTYRAATPSTPEGP